MQAEPVHLSIANYKFCGTIPRIFSLDSEEVSREDSAPKSMWLRMPRFLFQSDDKREIGRLQRAQKFVRVGAKK